MNISKFDKVTLKVIQNEAEAALKAVAQKYGLSVKQAGGSYDASIFKAKFEFATLNENGEANRQDVEDFKRYCSIFGFKPEDLGKEFTSNGKRYTVAGLKPGASRFPVIGVRADGKRFKFPAEAVKAKLL